MTSFHSMWLRLTRKFSKLCLEKFLDTSILVLGLVLWVGSSINMGKWSLISDITTPEATKVFSLLDKIWSMRDDE